MSTLEDRRSRDILIDWDNSYTHGALNPEKLCRWTTVRAVKALDG